MKVSYIVWRRVLLAATIAALALVNVPIAFAQSPTVLRFATFVGPNSFLNVSIWQPWFKQIEDASNGAVKIEFIAGGAAAKPNEVIDAVRNGIVDIGWSATSYNPGRFNAGGVAELPLIFHSPTGGAAGIAQVYEQGLLDGFGGVKVLGIATADVARLHHTADVKGLADFKGAKVRAAGTALSSMLDKLGATPVAVPITTLAESLAKRIVDGTAADWFSMEGFRLIDVTKTHINLAMGAPGIYVVMNKTKYDQLPPAAKAAFDKYSPRDFGMFWGLRLENESNRVRQVVASAAGHKVLEPTPAENAIWEAAGKDVIAAWVKDTKNGQAILEAFQKGVQAQPPTR